MASEDVKPLSFFIFGHPVTMSPSPEIHSVGFKEAGLPHTYERFDAEDVEDVVKKLKEDGFGGGSVTIPHKESLLPSMDELSDAAKTIGAVNTITKGSDGKLHGDNTDWLGIKNQLERSFTIKEKAAAGGSAPVCLLCGSGGTARAAAYALREMKAERVLIFNRTTSRAEALAEEFGFEAIADLSSLRELAQLDIVVDTLPGASQFVLPNDVADVLERHRPVVFEAAYIPRRTSFVQQALAAGCEVVEGIEMLFEQGCAQCEIWTKKAPAPRAKIAEALLEALFKQGSGHPAYAKMEPYESLPKGLVRETVKQEGKNEKEAAP
eukprot:CAMPEP_0206481914 /NCGR_PEP_ID=MMETSP0324_2-20121206/38491_1 /ASSEMBLY_ACC=CAM_ASM_000836 /TAXON_ID=2866 /ORGANISM="Crypthecodinium cohnii, Strain Seligo" /LENGTH=322 /DNA_ID=CAMNT_0053959619 /DNA_START=65 /DNA_END=1033 /DNA_ORIENTATION=-